MVDRFREQAAACAELGSPMYDELLNCVADDIEARGVSADVLAGHEDDPGPSALALRLAGSVHRLVLEGGAAELAAFYPSAGGNWELRGGWPAFERLLRDQPADVLGWLDQPPQTNEVGRATALMGGLLRIAETSRLPIRLLEIGSSGGLNLRVDKYFYTDSSGTGFGDAMSPVQLHEAWTGRSLVPRPDMVILERLGSDIAPIDVATPEGRVTLTSYVWPDQRRRIERLEKAFVVAAEVPAEVRRTDAVSFVRDIDLVEGTTTVLWHSVMWQYLDRAERTAVDEGVRRLGSTATERAPFAHVFLEPRRRTPAAEHEFLVVLERWPGGDWTVLGQAHPHGVPVRWER